MTNWQQDDIFAFAPVSKVINTTPPTDKEINTVIGEKEQKKSSSKEVSYKSNHSPKRSITMGIGGTGIKLLSKLLNGQKNWPELIAITTDLEELRQAHVQKKILIGKLISRGAGAHNDPLIGTASVEEDSSSIESSICGIDLLILVAGIGGGTGTGALPSICKIARNLRVPTLAIVTMPSAQEELKKQQNALLGLNRLYQQADSLFVIRSDFLTKCNPDYSMNNVILLRMISL